MTMLLCCGDALIDWIPVTSADGREAYLPVPGGSCCNLAIALARLGADAGFMGGISTDFFGDLLMGALQASQVSTRYVARLGLETTLGFVKLGDGEPQYVFYDDGTAARMWTAADSPMLGPEVRLLHIGSVTLINPPVADACVALFEAEKGRRVLCLDPNCRPTLTRDIASYRVRMDRLFTLSDIIRLSLSDLAFLMPDTTPPAAASLWLEGGARLVVVTRGAGGSTAYWPGGSVDVTAPETRVMDTIGAGDSFLAGLLVGLSEAGYLSMTGLLRLTSGELAGALAIASEAAAVTCTRSGADAPWRHEVPALVARVASSA
jgi:fructokinase